MKNNPEYSTTAKAIHLVFFFAIIGLCAYFPYMRYGVIPFGSDRVVEMEYIETELSPVTAEDDLERSVLLDEFKWCRYCHTMQPGAPDEPGPSLYEIFGRRAATVSGFPYSDVFIEAGQKGIPGGDGKPLYWTEKTIDEFITNPGEYIPGNRMFHGPVIISDPERRKKVINLLKKWTVEGSTAEAEADARAAAAAKAAQAGAAVEEAKETAESKAAEAKETVEALNK